MRVLAVVVVVLAACGSHHTGGGGADAPPLCDPTDPTCGTPVQPVIVGCAGCPTFPNPGSGTMCADPATDPTLVYPPDGVLLPPNMNVIAAQFMPGNNNAFFEIDFENAATDVRLETQCNGITNTRGTDTGGCDFELDPTDWMYVAMHNRGGDPVTVTVRGMPADMSCIGGSNSREINFGQEDQNGGIYYWQSMTVGGVAGNTGGIFRKDFGNPDPTPEPFLTPSTSSTTTTGKCVGCHNISRDGLKMTYGDDDADSDDEYGDLHAYLYDITTRTTGNTQVPAGFQSFEGAGHDFFFASDGRGMGMGPEALQYNGNTAAAATTSTFSTSTYPALLGMRVTHVDSSRDNTMLYFTAAKPITSTSKDDLHITNGSIWSAQVTAASGGATVANPSELVTPASADENDYYPAISPDGSTLIFNRAVGTTLATHDSYNNPNAALFAMIVPGGTPIPLTKANLHDTLTNSWPRWSPFVQMYKGKRIVWVTFSSTRDYGLRVQNENLTPATFNCYPPVSPENTSGDHKQPFDPNCTQPQIWMAAVSLDDLAAGTDGSYPAFWLPFQDFTAHNHIAQWADTIVMPPPNCQLNGQTCSTSMPCCDGSTCDSISMTCVSVIP
jgi:hypothetical protein